MSHHANPSVAPVVFVPSPPAHVLACISLPNRYPGDFVRQNIHPEPYGSRILKCKDDIHKEGKRNQMHSVVRILLLKVVQAKNAQTKYSPAISREDRLFGKQYLKKSFYFFSIIFFGKQAFVSSDHIIYL
jgi:hypothetical protein